MRYIYLDASKIPEAWLAQAKSITDAINAETDPVKRKAIIDGHTALWGKIKNALLSMSAHKCWYSEANDCVGDWHVDHFRPKAIYQWLAFDWTNYRIAGARPNRKKSDEFPLTDASKRASFATRDIAGEAFYLLDPTCHADVALVTFDEQGLFKPANTDALTKERVDITRERLELDSERLINRRQGIWETCQGAVNNIRKNMAANQNTKAALGSENIKSWAADVQKAVKATAPFSAVALACIKANSAEWILEIPTDLAA